MIKPIHALTEQQVDILINHGTERPFTGKFLNEHRVGIYRCARCHNDLFHSDTKFDAGCGWPSFYQTISESSLRYLDDYSLERHRIEIVVGIVIRIWDTFFRTAHHQQGCVFASTLRH